MTWVLDVHQANKVAAAKLLIISSTRADGRDSTSMPYLATALYALVSVPCDRVARVNVDEKWRLYVNLSWLDDCEVPDLAAELVALTWHLLMEHAGRALACRVTEATAEAWRAAVKLTVVDVLSSVDGGACVPNTYMATALYLRRRRPKLGVDRSAEEYYQALLGAVESRLEAEETDNQPLDDSGGSGVDGLPRPYELSSDPAIGEVDDVSAHEVRRVVAQEFREAMKGRGTQPGEALRWAQRILEPKIRWEELLTGTVRRAIGYAAGRVEYTRSRPSRRQSVLPNIVLPGTRRPLPRVAMVIDTSGSVDDALLGRALGEVDGAFRSMGLSDADMQVLSCDAEVSAIAKVRRVKDIRLVGGGGTDMSVGIGAAAALRPAPQIIVVFTDGWTPWPAAPPDGIAVIVALLGRVGEQFGDTPSWAKTIECRI